RELTFTKADQAWTKEAQQLEDELARAARGEADLDDVARRVEEAQVDFEEWEILYRLLLQVRLRTSGLESDAVVPQNDPLPTLRRRLETLAGTFRALWPPRRAARAR